MEESSLSELNYTDNQMYIVDLRRTVADVDSLEDALRTTQGLWEALYEQMNADETLWVIAPNDYRNGRMWPTAMAVADYAREESNLVLKNTITLHQWEDRGADMESAYDEILLFVQDKREYQFHKDRIRVGHVYEGNEWGGERQKGNSAYHDTEVKRYNPDGKDPGNVWLDEDRSQTDNQEVDETRPLPLTEAIKRCVLVGSEEGETVYIVEGGDDLGNTVKEEGRAPKSMDIAAVGTEVTE